MAGRRTLVFFDACVLMAASRSPSGGSAIAMEVCKGSRFQAAVSIKVIFEARVNIAEKFGEAELVRFYQQLALLGPEIIPPPSAVIMEQYLHVAVLKDVHVLASAVQSGAEYLLTLDKQHLLTPQVQTAMLPLKIMTPGKFLELLKS